MKHPFFKASVPPAARLAVLGLAVFVPIAAQAGFEWRGPIAPQVAAPAVAPALPPVVLPEAVALAPVISPGAPPALAAPIAPVTAETVQKLIQPKVEETAAEAPVPLVPVRQMSAPPKAPVALFEPAPELARVERPAPVQNLETLAPPAKLNAEPLVEVSSSEEGQLEGFGRNLPLAMAVTQVLPAGYSVSFAKGVNPGDKVSWSGGKPWRQALSDMLASRRLAFKAEEGRIFIFKAGQTSAPILPPPLPVTEDDGAEGALPTETFADSALDQPLPLIEPAPIPAPVSDGLPVVRNGREAVSEGASTVTPATPSLWKAEGGQMLRTVLTEWSRREGVELYWATDYDYRIPYSVVFSGSYPEAARDLIAQFSSLNPRPYARLHEAPSGGRVLAVRSEDLLDSKP